MKNLIIPHNGPAYEIDLTPEEVAVRAAEEKAYKAELPMKKWKADMALFDKNMPRPTEDLYDLLIEKGILSIDDLNSYELSVYNSEKVIRAKKPE